MSFEDEAWIAKLVNTENELIPIIKNWETDVNTIFKEHPNDLPLYRAKIETLFTQMMTHAYCSAEMDNLFNE